MLWPFSVSERIPQELVRLAADRALIAKARQERLGRADLRLCGLLSRHGGVQL